MRISEQHKVPGVCQGFAASTVTVTVTGILDTRTRADTQPCVSGGGRETLAPPCPTDTPESPSPSRAVGGRARALALPPKRDALRRPQRSHPAPSPVGVGYREGPHGLQGWVGEGAIAKCQSWGARPRGGTCVLLTLSRGPRPRSGIGPAPGALSLGSGRGCVSLPGRKGPGSTKPPC